MPSKAELVEARRLAHLRTFAPDCFVPGRLLYVGASILRSQCLPDLVAAGHQVTILEIWPDNVAHYRARGFTVVQGDVRQVGTLNLPRYDVAFWWHGPEHVALSDLPATLAALEELADLVVLACPWGESPQGAVYGNPHEAHRISLAPLFFTARGYRTWTMGRPGLQSRSQIIAVKRRNHA